MDASLAQRTPPDGTFNGLLALTSETEGRRSEGRFIPGDRAKRNAISLRARCAKQNDGVGCGTETTAAAAAAGDGERGFPNVGVRELVAEGF